MEKPTPSKGGGDVEFSFPNQDEIYVRWYYHFPTGWAEGLDDCSSGHLLAINTSYHGWLILDNAGSYATSMDLPNVEIGAWSDEGGNVWSAHCDPPSDVWDQVRSVRFDEVWGTERGSAEEITGANEWHHDYPNDRLYVYSTSAPDTAFTNPGIWVADNARRAFNLGETLGCPGRSTITVGGYAAENESYCWSCDNRWGPGKHISGDSTKPLYHRDEDTDNTYWSIYDHEDEWVCFEWYINNNDHATKLWIDGDLWLESTPAMFTWGEDGHFDDGFNKIIFSNYRHDETFPNTLYIDDVVVSTSYIGPRAESPELALTGAPSDQAIHLTWTVNTTLPVTSTWQIAYDGPAGDQPSPISGIVSPTRAYTLTGLTNYTWYTVTLNAMLDGTPFLTDTVRVMPSDISVYLPIVLRGN